MKHVNCRKTVLCHGESVFIRTSVDKCVNVVIYTLFLSPVISRLIENGAGDKNIGQNILGGKQGFVESYLVWYPE